MLERVKVSDINRKHPEYELRKSVWRDLNLLHEGGMLLKDSAELLLRQRPREDSDIYQARKERFTYQNLLATGLGWYSAAMFKHPPDISFKQANGDDLGTKEEEFYVDGFLNNCDGNNTSFVNYVRNTFVQVLKFGASYTFTDLPRSDGEPAKTLADQQTRGLLDPLLRMYSPINLINWKLDVEGSFEWVVIHTEKQESEYLSEGYVVDTWLHLDRSNFEVYSRKRKSGEMLVGDDSERTATLVNSGEHALSHVKRVPLREIQVLEGLWLANRSYLLFVDHLNQDNTLAWSLFMSNLAVPVIIGDVDATNLTTSETGFYQFPAGTTYTWSEPEGQSFEHSANRLESLREEAFRDMYLQAQGRSMRATPAMQSGRSKQLEMAPANDVLCGMGADLVSGMQHILQDVRDARRNPEVVPSVRGLHYEAEMTTEEVFAASSTVNMRIPSQTLEKYIYKKVAQAWMRDATPEDMSAVFEEIDAGPTMEEREQKDLERRMEAASVGVSDALGRISSKVQPPGRGGSGPKVGD